VTFRNRLDSQNQPKVVGGGAGKHDARDIPEVYNLVISSWSLDD
jgi:hypothetical protein